MAVLFWSFFIPLQFHVACWIVVLLGASVGRVRLLALTCRILWPMVWRESCRRASPWRHKRRSRAVKTQPPRPAQADTASALRAEPVTPRWPLMGARCVGAAAGNPLPSPLRNRHRASDCSCSPHPSKRERAPLSGLGVRTQRSTRTFVSPSHVGHHGPPPRMLAAAVAAAQAGVGAGTASRDRRAPARAGGAAAGGPQRPPPPPSATAIPPCPSPYGIHGR